MELPGDHGCLYRGGYIPADLSWGNLWLRIQETKRPQLYVLCRPATRSRRNKKLETPQELSAEHGPSSFTPCSGADVVMKTGVGSCSFGRLSVFRDTLKSSLPPHFSNTTSPGLAPATHHCQTPARGIHRKRLWRRPPSVYLPGRASPPL